MKLCLNGHEWVKQQLCKERIGFESLDNDFLSCREPERLQEVCDELEPGDVQSFFEQWPAKLPWPLTAEDLEAGYKHRRSLWQVEVSLTQVFDHPVQGRRFFEEVIRDNLDLGKPSRVSLLFPTRTTWRTPPPPHGYRTRVITSGVNPSLHIEHKGSHVKQCFKENHAFRTETTINNPGDFGVRKGVENLTYLRQLGDQVNHKLLELERVGHNCALSQGALDRLQKPTVKNGQKAPGLRAILGSMDAQDRDAFERLREVPERARQAVTGCHGPAPVAFADWRSTRISRRWLTPQRQVPSPACEAPRSSW